MATITTAWARWFSSSDVIGPDADRPTARVVTFAAGLAFLLLLVRTAWISDEAYITL